MITKNPPLGRVVAVMSDSGLRLEVERVVAAVSWTFDLISPHDVVQWAASDVLVTDVPGATIAAQLWPPEQLMCVLVSHADGDREQIRAAAERLGARHTLALPEDEARLATVLNRETAQDRTRAGRCIAVIGACGGAGATVFAAALALSCESPSLLVDVDARGGGMDLVLGLEAASGLRWPQIEVTSGAVGAAQLRSALPAVGQVAVLSAADGLGASSPVAVRAVVTAARRSGDTVVCDVSRQLGDVERDTLTRADAVILVAPATVRGCRAGSALTTELRALHTQIAMVVRGPSPSGLRAAEIARAVGLPLMARYRSQPHLAATLDTRGLRPAMRGPLGRAARVVIGKLSEPLGWSA